MSGIEAGIPLIELGLGRTFLRTTRVAGDSTHRAYPVEYALAQNAVAEAARNLSLAFTEGEIAEAQSILVEALDAFDSSRTATPVHARRPTVRDPLTAGPLRLDNLGIPTREIPGMGPPQ